jgi:hypothetical protein
MYLYMQFGRQLTIYFIDCSRIENVLLFSFIDFCLFQRNQFLLQYYLLIFIHVENALQFAIGGNLYERAHKYRQVFKTITILIVYAYTLYLHEVEHSTCVLV